MDYEFTQMDDRREVELRIRVIQTMELEGQGAPVSSFTYLKALVALLDKIDEVDELTERLRDAEDAGYR
jgi:hypothetical protein